MKFVRQKAETEAEKDLLLGLVTSTRFCRTILPILKNHLLQVDIYKTVVQWVKEFYKTYEVAPGNNLEKIYKSQLKNFKEEEREGLELILRTLSQRYEEKDNFNVDYYIDESITYLKKQSLIHHSEVIKALTDIGDLQGAEQEIIDYHKVAKATSSWQNPYDHTYMENYFLKAEESLMRFPGMLGEVLGDLKRKWLIGILGPMKRGKCLPGSTLVPLANGALRTIESIVKEERKNIITFNESKGKFIEGCAEKHFDNGVKKVINIKTKTGREIKLTHNHPLLTVTGWTEAWALKKGNRVAVPRVIPIFGDKTIPEHEIKIMAYLLAEGHIKNRALTFTNKNLDIQKDFTQAIEKTGDICMPQYPITLAVRNKWRRQGIVQQTQYLLAKYGVKRVLSYQKEIPDIIFELKKELLKKFLSILFTCDGSIWKDRGGILVCYCSSSRKLIEQVYHLLLRFGIVGKINTKKIKIGKPAWEIVISNKENVLRYIRNIGFVFDKEVKARKFIKLLDKRKDGRNLVDIFPIEFSRLLKEIGNQVRIDRQTYARDFWKKPPMSLVYASLEQKRGLTRKSVLRIAKFLENKELLTFVNSDILWDEIVEIEAAGEEQTYDLSVGKHHNFIANNFLVHNSFYLDEFRHIAVLNRLKVAFISLEMEHEEIAGRGYKRVSAMAEDQEIFVYPVFDCIYNQYDSCKKDCRTNHIKLVNKEGEKPPFSIENPYKPCTVCRGEIGGKYVPEVWYERMEKPKLTLSRMKKKGKGILAMYGDLVRLIAHPVGTVNLQDIERDLDLLEFSENFVPDVVVIDYADILKKEDPREFGRDAINTTWKALKSLSQKRNCLVVTGTQANRDSIEKLRVTQINTGEDIRKLAHVNSMMVLNQTPWEKKLGIMRIGLIAHRSIFFDEMTQVQVLQALDMGQTHLDSEIYRTNKNFEEGEETDD